MGIFCRYLPGEFIYSEVTASWPGSGRCRSKMTRLALEKFSVADLADELAVAQAVPQNLLIPLLAQRRRHDVFRALELRLLRAGLVECKILDERLDGDAHAALARGDGLIERFLATQMDDVSRRAGEFGEGHQVMHAIGIDGGRAAFVMLAGIGLVGGVPYI